MAKAFPLIAARLTVHTSASGSRVGRTPFETDDYNPDTTDDRNERMPTDPHAPPWAPPPKWRVPPSTDACVSSYRQWKRHLLDSRGDPIVRKYSLPIYALTTKCAFCYLSDTKRSHTTSCMRSRSIDRRTTVRMRSRLIDRSTHARPCAWAGDRATHDRAHG